MRTPHTSRPWYKHGWPWFLIALPAAAVIGSIVTLYFAVTTESSLVVDDYYQAGRTINQDLARRSAARELEVSADLLFGENSNVRVFLRARASAPVPGGLTLLLQHPTQASRDLSIPLHRIAEGLYEGTSPTPWQGHWYLTLSDDARRWQLSGRAQLPALDKVILHPTS